MNGKMFIGVAVWSACVGGGVPVAAGAITIPTVTIGNPGNAADPTTGFGAVGYTYNIGAYEVTNAQYAAFLNAKAASDPYGLYNVNMAGSFGGISRSGSDGSFSYATVAGRENHPVNWVSFWDATRFANWLHNGQGSGNTEDGAYTLGGVTNPVNTSVTRNLGWQWAVTSEDEWYKAAYHQPLSEGGDIDNYWVYPTGANGVPTTAEARYGSLFGNTVATGSFAPNYYGTFDLGGNVWEWNEAIVIGGPFTTETGRRARGGSFTDDHQFLRADSRGVANLVSHESSVVGFRVAAVPGPSSVGLLAVGGLIAARRRRG